MEDFRCWPFPHLLVVGVAWQPAGAACSPPVVASSHSVVVVEVVAAGTVAGGVDYWPLCIDHQPIAI